MLTSLRDRVRDAGSGLPRTYWVLCAGMFVNRVGSFVLGFLSVYLTSVRGASMATAGLVAALYGAGAMLASLAGGFFADHFGRRVTMVGSLLLGGLGMMAIGFAQDIRVIAPAMFVVAFLGEAYRPAMLAAVSDLVPAAQRPKAFGLLYWVINLGFATGAVLGGTLASISFTLLFLGDGLTSVLFALLIARRVPETRPAHHAPAPSSGRAIVRDMLAPFHDGPFGLFILLSFMVLAIFMQHITALPIDVSAHGISRISLGLVLAVNGAAIVLIQPLLAPILGRYDRSRVLALGAALFGLGFGVNALARDTAHFALGVLIWSVGEIHVLPVANAVVADVAPLRLRGRYQGAYGLSFGLAGLVAPLVGTAVMQRFGAASLWLGCLGMGLAVSLGHLALRPSLTRLREARARDHASGGA